MCAVVLLTFSIVGLLPPVYSEASPPPPPPISAASIFLQAILWMVAADTLLCFVGLRRALIHPMVELLLYSVATVDFAFVAISSMLAISNDVKSLVARAKDKKLKPNEYEGGSFSISNLGMFGVKHFSAIINPPQAAILAVGAGEVRPVVIGGKIEIATVMTVTLSLDHRVADGATGARFLQAFKRFIEQPAAMLL